jgi:hypothetical protein
MHFSSRLVFMLAALFACASFAVADVSSPPAPAAPSGEDELAGVSAARVSRGTLAVWSQRHAWLSRDDGGTFTEVLAGAAPIGAAVVAADGSFYVARGRRVGVLRPDGTSEWSQVGAEPNLMFANRDTVGFIDSAVEARKLRLSSDGGRSWRPHTLPYRDYGTIAAAHLDDDGALQLAIDVPCGDICGCDHLDRHLGHLADERWLQLSWDDEEDRYPHDETWDLGRNGRAYVGRADTGDQMRFLAFGPDGKSTSLGRLAERASLRVADNGRATFAQSGRVLYRLDGARAPIVDRAVPDGILRLAVDSQGRALALSSSRLYRLEDGRWEPLLAGVKRP